MGINRLVKSEDTLRECLAIMQLDDSHMKCASAILTIVPFNHVTLISGGDEVYNKKDITVVNKLADVVLPIFMPELTLTRITGLTVRFTKDSPVEISVSRYGVEYD
ncbi:hypothetical protein NVP1285O_20 [Vibrio phage 1.285.O._10N.286.55.C12]|nr:hypothetical protein NVP1046O_22 [Vibrio phage 1.046.O._10N.286.52.E3]AUS01418.1 hypothetical protein NVP1285O_20 [Vibrio phage 1.285.O._10N.286.55.C12]